PFFTTSHPKRPSYLSFFFFNDTPTTEIYTTRHTLSLHDALPILVRHRSGAEGIDELWGEPFKAFAYPIEKFYESRYIKIAMTMRGIDEIADVIFQTFGGQPLYPGIEPTIMSYATAAKI